MTRYSLTDLGVPLGFGSSQATALNDRCQVIGSLRRTAADVGNPATSFFWEEGTSCVVDRVILRALNNEGQAVGDRDRGTAHTPGTPVLYENGQVHTLFSNDRMGHAEDINDQGQIVGWAYSPGKKAGRQAVPRGGFVWENGRRRWLECPSSFYPDGAVALNNAGRIVGNVMRSDPSDLHGVVWDGGEMTLLDIPLEFTQCRAVSVNDCGQVLARALFWQEDAARDIFKRTMAGQSTDEIVASLPAGEPMMCQKSVVWNDGRSQVFDGLANAINDVGQVVGWTGCDLGNVETASSRPSAFIWQNGEWADLNGLVDTDSDWRLVRANDINNRGEIVGHGDHNGQTRAFLLRPVAVQL